MKNPAATKDKAGRPYAQLSRLKTGDMIAIDAGFACASAGKRLVKADDNGRLFFACRDGNHYLDGQADDGEHCVGVYLSVFA